jgi:addiction module HigA family antidote
VSIKRNDVEVDFSDIASGRRLPPVHPGEILRDEFLTPMKISVYELANAIKVPRTRANDIVLGRRTRDRGVGIWLRLSLRPRSRRRRGTHRL